MASVSEYLKKLLYQYDCVVVPELGAFLTHYQPASFTEASGLYLPPRKRVAYNEALRLDDGILANYIMLHEPVTRDGAQRHINQFVSDLRQQVETTGRFEIEGIGSFSHNDEGRLQFEPSLRHNFHGDAYGMTAISATAIDRQLQTEPTVDAVPVTALGPVLAQEEATGTPLRRQLPAWRVAAAALLVGSLGFVSYFSVTNPDQPLQSSVDPANLLRVSASWISQQFTTQTTESVAATSKPPKTIAATAVESKPSTPASIAATPASTKAVKPVEPIEAKPVVVTQPIAAPVVVSKPRYIGPFFTVIAGSFASKRNALRFRRQLQKAGYTDAFVIMPSTKGQLYKVAAAGSADRNEAVASATTISELAGTNAWILTN